MQFGWTEQEFDSQTWDFINAIIEMKEEEYKAFIKQNKKPWPNKGNFQ